MTMSKLTIQLIKKLCGIDLEQLQADNRQLQEQNEHLTADLQQAEQKIHQQHLQLSDAEKAFEDAEKRAADIEQEAEKAKAEAETIKKEAEETIRQLKVENEAAAHLWQEKELEMQKRMEIAEEDKNTAKKETEAAKAEIAAAIAETQNAKAETEVAKAETATAIVEAQNAKAETAEAKTEIEATKAAAEAIKKEAEETIRQLTETNNDLVHQLSALEATCKQQDDTICSLQNQVVQLEEENEAAAHLWQEKELEMQRRMKIAEEEKNTAKKETEAAKAEIAAAIAETQNAKAETEVAKAETATAIVEAQNAKAETAEAKTEIEATKAAAEAIKKEAEKTIQQLTETNNDLVHQLSALEATCKQQDDTICSLQSQVAQLKEEEKRLAEQKEQPEKQPEKQTEEKTKDQTAPEEESTPSPTGPTEKEKDSQPTREEKDEQPAREEKGTAFHTAGQDILEAYQEMKARLEESTLRHPFTRITTATNGNQYLFLSRTLGLKAELFIWGVEGIEMVLDEPHFVPYNEIADIEGIDSPFSTEVMDCDFSDEGNATEVAETLLTAICRYQPVRVTYRDKNGRISDRNLYWISFLPDNQQMVSLPNPHLFEDMFEDHIDTDHLIAMCAHHAEPRIFIINQILSLQVFDVFATTRQGIEAQLNGLRAAVECGQEEVAEIIYYSLPEQFREQAIK